VILRSLPRYPLDPEGFDRQKALDAHVMRSTDHADSHFRQMNPSALRLLAGSGLGLLARGDPASVQVFERIVRFYCAEGESFSRDYWAACSNLAAAYRLSAQLQDAVELDIAAVQSLTEQFGNDDLDTISASNSLATSLWRLARFDEAIAIQADVVQRRSRIEGQTTHSTTQAMANLAVSLLSADRVSEAIELLEPFVHAEQDSDGNFDVDILTLRMNLGTAYSQSDRFDESKKLLEPVVQQLEISLGALHPHTLTAQSNLAACLLGSGDNLSDAIVLLCNVYGGRQASLGETHPDTLDTANLLRDLGVDIASL